jgi:hypothetical protein
MVLGRDFPPLLSIKQFQYAGKPLKTTNWEGKHIQGGEQELMRSTGKEQVPAGQQRRGIQGISPESSKSATAKAAKNRLGAPEHLRRADGGGQVLLFRVDVSRAVRRGWGVSEEYVKCAEVRGIYSDPKNIWGGYGRGQNQRD